MITTNGYTEWQIDASILSSNGGLDSDLIDVKESEMGKNKGNKSHGTCLIKQSMCYMNCYGLKIVEHTFRNELAVSVNLLGNL